METHKQFQTITARSGIKKTIEVVKTNSNKQQTTLTLPKN